jgi:hypothetical protein
MEEYLMLQTKLSLKDISSSQEEKDNKRHCQDERDQREDKPKECRSGGMSGKEQPLEAGNSTCLTPIYTEQYTAL